MRRIPHTLALIAWAASATARCTEDACLRAVQETDASAQDCASFLGVTATPATSPITRTATTEASTGTAEPSRRWIQQRAILDVLLGRDAVATAPMPAYASACASAAAYASACSCLGVASTVTATQLERAGAKNTSSLHTTTRPSLNITHPLALNHTRVVPSLNGTSARFGNSSTSTSATATPSATIDRTCGATTTPFALRASVPGGNGSAVVVDGWFVGLTGDAALLLPPATNDNNGNGNNARFSVEGSGHLCAVGVEGSSGNAAIAVVNTFNGDDDGGGSAGSAGSAVYFVDGELLGVVEGQGYAALACEEAADGGEVKCAHGDWGAWTRCGLGLGITGQTDGNAVVDGWNCTGVALEAVFAS